MYKGYSKRARPSRRRLMRRRIRTFRAWIAAGVVCVLCGSQAYCASVTLAWDPSPDSDVAGYNLSYGPAPIITRTSSTLETTPRFPFSAW